MKFPLSLIALLASTVFAVPLTPDGVISHKEIVAKSSQGLRLVSLEEHEATNAAPVWKTESEVLELIKGSVGFVSLSYPLQATVGLPFMFSYSSMSQRPMKTTSKLLLCKRKTKALESKLPVRTTPFRTSTLS